MAEKTYRVGIVGLSGIAARPPAEAPAPFRNTMSISHAGALAYMSKMEVVGYCDLVLELLEAFEREILGEPSPRAQE